MKSAKTPSLTKEEILKLMEYQSDVGLVWRVSRGRYGFPGNVVGSQITLGGVRVYTHHVVWFIFNGYWPSDRGQWVDFKDGNLDNRILSNIIAVDR